MEPNHETTQDDLDRLDRFGKAIDAIRTRVQAQIGADDVAYIKRVRRVSVAMEITGRVLIHVSPEPMSFLAGVGALWIHKQLEATEIGHTALHGAFDGLPGAEAFASKTFPWDTPIDEASWRRGHNLRHHQHTNIAGRDPDIDFGPVRLTEQTPHRRVHYFQLAWALSDAASFLRNMNLHFTGVEELLRGRERADAAAIGRAAWRTLRKYIPYYTKEYGLYPALAGPAFAKVMFGNWLAATIRDLYTAATIYCGHIGEDVASYPHGTRAGGRGVWYKMQIEAANNFEVSLPISILCGALDHQIEHHLFPRFPTNRLREIAPEVRRACIEHGVEYRTASWGATLVGVVKHLARLSFPTPRDRARRAEPARRIQTDELLAAA